MSSIFDRDKLSSSLLDLRLDWSRILVTKDSYEYIESSILIIDNRIDWFFRLDVLETIYDEEILHFRMSRSNLIDIFILTFDNCIQDSSTKSTDSNQLLEALRLFLLNRSTRTT